MSTTTTTYVPPRPVGRTLHSDIEAFFMASGGPGAFNAFTAFVTDKYIRVGYSDGLIYDHTAALVLYTWDVAVPAAATTRPTPQGPTNVYVRLQAGLLASAVTDPLLLGVYWGVCDALVLLNKQTVPQSYYRGERTALSTVGSTRLSAAFTSFSTDPAIAHVFADGGPGATLLQLQDRGGALCTSIARYSRFPGEQEHLVAPNVPHVLHAVGDGGGAHWSHQLRKCGGAGRRTDDCPRAKKQALRGGGPRRQQGSERV